MTAETQKHEVTLFGGAGGAVSTMLGSMEELAGLTASGFLPSLKLFSGKTEACGKGLIGVGRFGIQKSADSIQDLGESVDIIPLAIKAKAIDSSERGKCLVVHDQNHPLFKQIAARASQKEDQALKKNNMFGPSFLVYERSTGKFLEFFCGGFYPKLAANELLEYLPLTEADVAALLAKNPAGNYKPRDPRPVTLKAVYMDKVKHPCHAPVVQRCSVPFTPPVDQALSQIAKFVNVPAVMNGPSEDAETESTTDAQPGKRAR